MITLKTCKGCGEDFPETTDYFHADGKSRFRSRCKICCKDERARNRARLDSITDAMVPAALALHRGGFTYEQIADDLGVTKDAVVSLFADQMRAA